ncbi:diaminopimelate decarboxylase [bacterium]|nr:diaminopimelate decarboxylase [bacterium]
MQDFQYSGGRLCCEEVPLESLAGQVGTPYYVYSERALTRAFTELDRAFSGIDHLVCFSVKSNANLAVVKHLGSLGAGSDIVSGGELYRSLRAGIPGERIVFSGVGKSDAEIRYALESGILCFNVESVPELEAIDRVAAGMNLTAPVSLRINPDVESHTHEYTATGKKEKKFGVPLESSFELYREVAHFHHLRPFGLDMHIGSQIVTYDPFVEALTKLIELYRRLGESGVKLQSIDIGGGLGIRYKDEEPMCPLVFARAILPLVKPLGCRLILEPGRYISGNAGALVTRVVFYKQTAVKNFAIVDAGMNDLIRPSLYGSYHEILPVAEANGAAKVKMDVVGPICESGDFLAHDRELAPVRRGDLLAVLSAGAYGFVMSSNYNSRPRVAEVLVSGGSHRVVRRAETFEDLVRGEEM